MQIKRFVFNKFKVNTYIVSNSARECIIIDAGCYTEQEKATTTAYIRAENLKPIGIYNTHGHVDHVLGNAFLSQQYQLPTYLHPADLYNLDYTKEHGKIYYFNVEQPPAPQPLGDEVTFGSVTLHVLHTPGHTKGGVIFYSSKDEVAFTGDTLFAGCIGRTDLPGGDYDEIMHSLHTQLLSLPDDTDVLAGHGYATQIGRERLQNPFLQ
jgi:glyoxylase-like metal-dependent hydrolase (beta-lactamase superfamily II)